MLQGPVVSILLLTGLPVIAVVIGIIVFAAKANNEGERVPSYNELKVDNERLRKENADLKN